MDISLPWLWVAGHLTAPFGFILAIYHLIKEQYRIALYCALGGIATCAFLAYVLFSIDRSFFGPYVWAAWVIAFFAGYFATAEVAYPVIALRKRLAPTGDEIAAARVRTCSNWRSSRLGQSDTARDA